MVARPPAPIVAARIIYISPLTVFDGLNLVGGLKRKHYCNRHADVRMTVSMSNVFAIWTSAEPDGGPILASPSN